MAKKKVLLKGFKNRRNWRKSAYVTVLGEGPTPEETKPSTEAAGGWVSRTRWPDLSKAADRSRNSSTAAWPESQALQRSCGFAATTVQMAKGKLRGYTFLSRKATYCHRLMIPFGTEVSLHLAWVPSVFHLLEGKDLISRSLCSFAH